MDGRLRRAVWAGLTLATAAVAGAQAQDEDYCTVLSNAVAEAPIDFLGVIGGQHGPGWYGTSLYLPQWDECSVLERNLRWAWYCHAYGESGRGQETGLWVFEEVGRCFPDWDVLAYEESSLKDAETSALWEGGHYGEGVLILVSGYDDLSGDSGVTLTVSPSEAPP